MIAYRSTSRLRKEMIFERNFRSEREMKKYIFRKGVMFCKNSGKERPPFYISDISISEREEFDISCGFFNVKYVGIRRFCGDRYMHPMCIGAYIEHSDNKQRLNNHELLRKLLQ